VLLLGANSSGTETLKNLVLPGVGSITIVDGDVVSERDCGNNFFVTEDSIGKPKAEVIKTWISLTLSLGDGIKSFGIKPRCWGRTYLYKYWWFHSILARTDQKLQSNHCYWYRSCNTLPKYIFIIELRKRIEQNSWRERSFIDDNQIVWIDWLYQKL